MKFFKRFPLITLAVVAALFASAIAINASLDKSATPADEEAPVVQPAPSSRVEYSTLNSASLGRELKYAIQYPPSYNSDAKRRYPVLYFLHGMNGSEQEFERRGVADAVNRLRDGGKVGELIIVAPDGGNSFYLNAKNGVRYEDAIVKDLIPHIEKTYRAIGKPDGRAIQGISMGGFGALLIAFKHPEMFSSVTTHSAALFEELPDTSGSNRRAQFLARMIGNLFGDPPDEAFFQANNPINLAETHNAAIKKSGLKIYFDVGDQDRYGFQGSNKLLDERLTKAGVPHEYHMFPGNHGWEYMISVADRSYGFLWQSLKANGKP